MSNYWYNLIYVVIAGAFGGMLYAIQNKMIILPSIKYSEQKDETTQKKYKAIELGIIADLLFGIAGGLLIFLITPAVPDQKKILE